MARAGKTLGAPPDALSEAHRLGRSAHWRDAGTSTASRASMMRCDLPSPAHASGRVEERTEDRYHTLREGSSDQEPCRISTRNGLDSRSASFQAALHPSNHGRSPQLNALRPINGGWNLLTHTIRDIVLHAFDLLPSYVDQVDLVSSVELPRPPDHLISLGTAHVRERVIELHFEVPESTRPPFFDSWNPRELFSSVLAVGDCIAKGTSDLTPRLRAPLVPLNRRKKP